jgi:hypothetical protein
MKTQRHKDTEAQKARKKPWLRAFVPLCLCVSVSAKTPTFNNSGYKIYIQK